MDGVKWSEVKWSGVEWSEVEWRTWRASNDVGISGEI